VVEETWQQRRADTAFLTDNCFNCRQQNESLALINAAVRWSLLVAAASRINSRFMLEVSIGGRQVSFTAEHPVDD
jgi:hypothetical protein